MGVGMTVKVRISDENLNTVWRQKRAKTAASHLEVILNSEQFKTEILSMPQKWRIGETSKYKSASNKAILDLILAGKEEWNDDQDNEIDLIVDDYYKRWSRVVGYMNPGKPTIWVNTKFFDSMSMKKVVSNFLHEYGHTLGLRHGGSYFRSSIPYYLNEVVEKLYPILIEGKEESEDKKMRYVCRRRIWYKPWTWKRKCWYEKR